MSLAILDVDGTLVDTNYQHTLAWYRAFREHDLVLALWRIHRHIGMGGDQLVPALTDKHIEAKRGDAIRSAESRYYQQLIAEDAGASTIYQSVAELRRDLGHTPLR